MNGKLLGNTNRGLLFVVSAPAGTGKSTLIAMLQNEFPDNIIESCSCTTRLPRIGEVTEKHYDFITNEEFEEKIAAQDFLEYAKVFGHYYGTRKEEVDLLLAQGKHVVLVIDTQGALKVQQQKLEAIFIFISPPSFDELRKRLVKRSTEDEERIQERLLWAKQEIGMVSHYDYHIINDNLDVTYQILRSIFIAEEHKRR